MLGFYDKVIEDFGKKLFDKYNQKEQGFDSEMIDQIKSRVRAKMDNPKDLFSKALEIKHRSLSHDLLIRQTSDHGQVKKEEEEDPHADHEEEADYANVFDVQDGEVKKEEGDDLGIIKHEPNEDLDDEKDEEDEREKREAIERIKNNLHIHIVGTYERENKKHVAKDESTKICLENVFIKCEGKSD